MIGDRSISMDLSGRARALQDNDVEHQLFNAIESGNSAVLSRFILANGLSGAKLDEFENEDCEHLLACAVRLADADMVEVLLKAGAGIDRRSGRSWTALHIAASAGLLHIARMLLAHGAEPSLRAERGLAQGMNALHIAAVEGHVDLVTELLQAGNDSMLYVEDGRYKGWNALHLCSSLGYTAAAEALIKAGTPIDATVRNGDTRGFAALHIAAFKGHAGVITSLIKARCDIAVSVRTGTYEGCKALHLAALKNHPGVADVLIEAGADCAAPVDVGRLKGWDALSLAASKGNSRVAGRLLTFGVDCNRGLQLALSLWNWHFANKLAEDLPFQALPTLDLTPVFKEAPVSGRFAINQFKIRQQRFAQIVGVRYLSEIADNAGSGADARHKEEFVQGLAGKLRSMSLPHRARALAAMVFASTMEEGIPPHAPVLYALFLLDDLDAPQRTLMRKDIIAKIRMLDIGYMEVDSDGTRDGFVQILGGRDKLAWVPWLTRQLLRQLQDARDEKIPE
jgi:ankyrin repeat protein